MGFRPPPSQNKSHMLSQYYIWNLCWRRFAIEGEVLPWDFFRGNACHMVLFPWGSPAMGFLPGEGLPYGIPSGGTLPYGIISAGTISHLFTYYEICVGGDIP